MVAGSAESAEKGRTACHLLRAFDFFCRNLGLSRNILEVMFEYTAKPRAKGSVLAAMKSTSLPLAVLVTCLLAGPSAWADETLGTAHALMGQGRAAEAYTLLKARESERAGDPEFDYLLGIAALEDVISSSSSSPADAVIGPRSSAPSKEMTTRQVMTSPIPRDRRDRGDAPRQWGG